MKAFGRFVSLKLFGAMAVAAVVGMSAVGAAPEGEWKLNYSVQDQEVEATLTLERDGDGKLGGTWVNQFGESALENAAFEDGKLSFTRRLEFNGNALELDFDGTVDGGKITGMVISEFGEFEVAGELVGGADVASLVGTWSVRYHGTQGNQQERRSTVTVNGDMTGKVEYANRDEAISLNSSTQDGEDVTYEYTVQFGDNPFVVKFVGKIDGDALSGNYVNAQGNVFANVEAQRKTAVAIRINAGGGEVTDAAGNVWAADQAYTEGGWGYVGGDLVDRGGINIDGAETADLYRTERYSLDGYKVTVPNGTYTVRLHFAETYDEGISGVGDRVFGVSVEDASGSVDPVKDSGGLFRAAVKEFEVEVTDGVIDIDFSIEVQNPMINAVEVIGG